MQTMLLTGSTESSEFLPIYNQIQKGLKLPTYFGKNLDALYDCLCDFSWLDAREIHVVMRDYDAFLSKEPKNNRWNILGVFNDAAMEWKGMKGRDKVKFEIYIEPSQKIKQDLADAEVWIMSLKKYSLSIWQYTEGDFFKLITLNSFRFYIARARNTCANTGRIARITNITGAADLCI